MGDLAKSKWSTTATKSETSKGLGTSKWALSPTKTVVETKIEKDHDSHLTDSALNSAVQNLGSRLNRPTAKTKIDSKSPSKSGETDKSSTEVKARKAREATEIREMETERAKHRSKKTAANLEWRDTGRSKTDIEKANGRVSRRNNGRGSLSKSHGSSVDSTKSRVADASKKSTLQVKHEPVDMQSLQAELDNLGDDNDDDWDDI